MDGVEFKELFKAAVETLREKTITPLLEAVDGAAAEREPIGRLSGREVHRIHRWGRAFDEDGYGLHAENAGPHQGF